MFTYPIVALLIFFGFLCLTLIIPTRVIAGPWLFLLRSFFPNWRFYHRVGYQPGLWVRVLNEQGWQPWQAWQPRAKRRLRYWIHNPDINLMLANQNLIEHLNADLQKVDSGVQAQGLVSYQLVKDFALHVALSLHASTTAAPSSVSGPLTSPPSRPISQFQFQIRLAPPYQAGDENSAVLTSPALDLSS